MGEITFSSYQKCDVCGAEGCSGALVSEWPHEGIDTHADLCFQCTERVRKFIEIMRSWNAKL